MSAYLGCGEKPPSPEAGVGNALLFLAFVIFGAKKGLLVYRMDVRCQKRPPTVRDAFSKALGAKNRLLRYGREIRYQEPPPTVRDASSMREFFSVQYMIR